MLTGIHEEHVLIFWLLGPVELHDKRAFLVLNGPQYHFLVFDLLPSISIFLNFPNEFFFNPSILG